MAEDTNRALHPPYVPFSAFKSLLVDLQGHLPSKVDRSVLRTGRSGSVANGLQTGLRFLGLITADDSPTPLLRELLASEGDEASAAMLRKVLDEAYGSAIRLDELKDVTRQHFESKFNAIAGGTSTARKARKFYLDAAKQAGATISPRLKVRASPAKRSVKSGANGTTSQTAHTPKPKGKGEVDTGGVGSGSGGGAGGSSSDLKLLRQVLARYQAKPDTIEAWLEGMIEARTELAG